MIYKYIIINLLSDSLNKFCSFVIGTVKILVFSLVDFIHFKHAKYFRTKAFRFFKSW